MISSARLANFSISHSRALVRSGLEHSFGSAQIPSGVSDGSSFGGVVIGLVGVGFVTQLKYTATQTPAKTLTKLPHKTLTDLKNPF
jgi:hypothetical protein